MLYIAMNPDDISTLNKGELKVFAVPLGKAEKSPYNVGDIIGVKEQFKKVTTTIDDDQVNGVKYRFDDLYVWEHKTDHINHELLQSSIEENARWSAAKSMPEYAVRRFMTITKVDVKTLSAFTEEDIKAMNADYASQGNPQLVLEEYLPIKNQDLMNIWWRKRYKSTLKNNSDPIVVILHMEPAELPQ